MKVSPRLKRSPTYVCLLIGYSPLYLALSGQRHPEGGQLPRPSIMVGRDQAFAILTSFIPHTSCPSIARKAVALYTAPDLILGG